MWVYCFSCRLFHAALCFYGQHLPLHTSLVITRTWVSCFLEYWQIISSLVKINEINITTMYFLGHFLHLCSIFYRQNNYVASGAGHEAICMTMGLIVFKNPPQQRKLKKPKNQLTESCKFVKSPAIVTPLEQQNILNY